jgi:hypothetical protein
MSSKNKKMEASYGWSDYNESDELTNISTKERLEILFNSNILAKKVAQVIAYQEIIDSTDIVSELIFEEFDCNVVLVESIIGEIKNIIGYTNLDSFVEKLKNIVNPPLCLPDIEKRDSIRDVITSPENQREEFKLQKLQEVYLIIKSSQERKNTNIERKVWQILRSEHSIKITLEEVKKFIQKLKSDPSFKLAIKINRQSVREGKISLDLLDEIEVTILKKICSNPSMGYNQIVSNFNLKPKKFDLVISSIKRKCNLKYISESRFCEIFTELLNQHDSGEE